MLDTYESPQEADGRGELVSGPCVWCGGEIPMDPETGYQDDVCSHRCRDAIEADAGAAACAVCGCTDLRGCVDPATGIACWWVDPNLCSACAAPRPSEPVLEARARAIIQRARAALGADLGGRSVLDLLADNLDGRLGLADLRVLLVRIGERNPRAVRRP